MDAEVCGPIGTLVVDERIYGIRRLALGNGAILAEVDISPDEALLIPVGGFDWRLHAPDGTYVCRGRTSLGRDRLPALHPKDFVRVTLQLNILGKKAEALSGR